MRFIDADDLMDRLQNNHWNRGNDSYYRALIRSVLMDVISDIEKQPSIDAVPVFVRCKDCKNWEHLLFDENSGCYCPFVDRYTTGYWFCADGEREEDV